MKISLLIVLLLILGACAQAPKTIPIENPEQVWRLHATYLYNHHIWQANMSVIGETAEEKFKTRLNWNQKKDSYEIRLRDFIGEKNLTAANKVAEKIIEATNKLSQHPRLGKPVTDLPAYRDLAIPFGARGYILRYRISEDVLYIVHVRHYQENTFE